MKTQNNHLKSENDKLSSNIKFATQQSIDCTNQIESLHEKLLSQRDLSTHLKGQVDDLSARLSETRQKWQEEVAQRDSKIAEAAAALQAQEDAAQDTASQLASLQKSLAYMENVNKLNEQKWQQQVRQLQAENQQLLHTSQTLDSVRSENDILQRNIMNALREKDEGWREASLLRDELTKVLTQLQDKQGSLTQTQQRLAASAAEKAEAVAALQQTMKVVRELSGRLQKEKKVSRALLEVLYVCMYVLVLVIGTRCGRDAAGVAHPDLAAAPAVKGVGVRGHIRCAAERAAEEQGAGEENPHSPTGYPIASGVRVTSGEQW